MIKSTKLLYFLIISCLALAFVLPVFAEESAENTSEEVSVSKSPEKKELKFSSEQMRANKERLMMAREKNLEIRETMKTRASEAATKRAEKLSEARLKLCKARANTIGTRLKTMHQRGITIHKGHEKIFVRVDEFYSNKLVPNGYTLSNYADLKAEVEANKANVLALHGAVKSTGLEFSCDSEDPKSQVDAFKEDMQELIDANKAYKESIKLFVQAVRDLAKTAKAEKISASPTAGEDQEL